MGNVRYTVDFRSVYATVLERWLGRPVGDGAQRRFRQLSSPSIVCSSSILFLGSGGARFVVARQLRASGGMWMRFGETQIHVDPGPRRAGSRAFARAAVQSARARRDRALAQASRPFRRRQRADRGDDVGRFSQARRGAGAGRRVRRRARRVAVRCAASSSASNASNRAADRISSATSSSTRRCSTSTRSRRTDCTSLRRNARRYLPCGRYFDGLAADYAKHQPDVLIVNVLRYGDQMNVDHLTWADARRVVDDIRPKSRRISAFWNEDARGRSHSACARTSKTSSVCARLRFTTDSNSIWKRKSRRRPSARERFDHFCARFYSLRVDRRSALIQGA